MAQGFLIFQESFYSKLYGIMIRKNWLSRVPTTLLGLSPPLLMPPLYPVRRCCLLFGKLSGKLRYRLKSEFSGGGCVRIFSPQGWAFPRSASRLTPHVPYVATPTNRRCILCVIAPLMSLFGVAPHWPVDDLLLATNRQRDWVHTCLLMCLLQKVLGLKLHLFLQFKVVFLSWWLSTCTWILMRSVYEIIQYSTSLLWNFLWPLMSIFMGWSHDQFFHFRDCM